jgi:Protein of unknown function (DUF3293)
MRNDDLWETYATAHISCVVDGRTIRLRGPEIDGLPADPLFVLTAWNPGGVERDRAANDAAERALEAELTADGRSWWPADGHSPDESWSEPGAAVGSLDRDAACALGEQFGQLAVYELTDAVVRVVRCVDRAVTAERPRVA